MLWERVKWGGKEGEQWKEIGWQQFAVSVKVIPIKERAL